MRKPVDDKPDEKIKNIKSRSGKKNYTGKRNNKKVRSKEKDGYGGESTNDPAWYSQSPELLRDAASIPFSWPVGTPLRTSPKLFSDVVPGVCAIHLHPTVGTALNENAPVNVAAAAIYSWVRHANSGHSNYDAPDLMMYILAMSNVYSFVVWMQRIYSYICTYDQRNRYLADALCYADGVSPDSIRVNLADFRYFINAYINKVASLAVPNTMPIFNRLAMLYSNVYSEGPSIKDQLYMYRPDQLGWYKFEIDSDTGMGKLVFTPMTIAGSYATSQEIKNYAASLFNAIWQQEDFGIMSGDILKAYDGNVIKLSPIPTEFSLVPIYDALVLHQMKNAKIASVLAIADITQTANGLIAQSIVMDNTADSTLQAVMYADALRDKILSTDFDNPTPDVVIESTRLMYGYDSYDGVFYAGSEIAVKAVYWSYANNGTLGLHSETTGAHIYSTSSPTLAQTTGILQCVHYMSNFKYHPEKIYYGINGGAVIDDMGFRSWDIDNYAVLNNNDIIKMHEAALLSLFAVPAIAKIS